MKLRITWFASKLPTTPSPRVDSPVLIKTFEERKHYFHQR